MALGLCYRELVGVRVSLWVKKWLTWPLPHCTCVEPQHARPTWPFGESARHECLHVGHWSHICRLSSRLVPSLIKLLQYPFAVNIALFVLLKFGLCWFVVSVKHCSFTEKYCWSSSSEQSMTRIYIIYIHILLLVHKCFFHEKVVHFKTEITYPQVRHVEYRQPSRAAASIMIRLIHIKLWIQN